MGVVPKAAAMRALAALAVLVSSGFVGAQGAAASTTGFAVPGDHSYTVPAGATSITVLAVGAAGGNCLPAHGGRGASITATVPVAPGEVLVVGVGGGGGPCGTATAAPGGIGGGGTGGVGHGTGNAGAGGGGASVVAPGSSSPDFAHALVVAGGGGGSTDFNVGVNGGDAGSPGNDGTKPGSGGAAGTQSAGGAGGVAGDSHAQAGLSGSLGAGGAGGNGAATPGSNAIGGGGGGGGYYGGGGGGGAGTGNHDSGSGGGGSSFVIAGATNVAGPTLTTGGPEVTITPNFTVAPPAKIVVAIISDKHHWAKFFFEATGHASGLQCALVKKKHHKWSPASFSSCLSPRRYNHLKRGKYRFEVRSVAAGNYGTPAIRRFTIT